MLQLAPQVIKPAEYITLLASFRRPITIDVRDVDYNCDGGIIANSLHVPFMNVVKDTAGIEPLRDADGCFIYCRTSAARALLSANRIKQAFPNLPTYIIRGGIIAVQREAPDVPVIQAPKKGQL